MQCNGAIFWHGHRQSLDIVANRARAGGLSNVQVKVFSFNADNLDEFTKEVSFDLGIGLHCCGRFTDLVMEACRLARADCVVVPCCNGKIDQGPKSMENFMLEFWLEMTHTKM